MSRSDRAALRRGFNALLDGLVRRRTVLAGRSFDSYFLWVHTGVGIGTAVVFALAATRPVSFAIIAVLVAMVAVLSFALFKSKKLSRRSRPWLKWATRGVYHFQIMALVAIVSFLRLARQPVLVYLDILVVGMLVYQAFGRIGCLMAGCCHGRPHAWGVRYGKHHAETGYVFFQRGIRLFPIQLFEAVWLFLLAAAAVANLFREVPPGENVSWYIVGYGAGRFVLEFLRGDLRPYRLRGFTEPQWTAMVLTAVVTGLEFAGVLSLHWWHAGVLLGMITAVGIRSVGGSSRTHALSRRRHADPVGESHQAMDAILREAGLVPFNPGDDRAVGGNFGALYLRRAPQEPSAGPGGARAGRS